MPKQKKLSYADAGVDIDEMTGSLSAVKKMVKATATRGVLSSIGSFGGLFAAPGRDSVLVASTDGVGTKLKVAALAGRHDTVGQDIVNHCVNDILVQGASPLFFLDYLGTSKLRGPVFKDIVSGICKACRQNGCALLGGETAEMPGLYPPDEYDLVGTIVGTVEKKRLVTGSRIRCGDVLIGLPSTGLHTNGYSLARRVIFKKAGLGVNDLLPGTKRTVAQTLLAVHKSYLAPVQALMKRVPVNGMAHITGGGLVDNIPRILPSGTRVVIDRAAWNVPAVFRFLEQEGNIDHEEMYRVFNMGIGFVVIVSAREQAAALDLLKKVKARPIVIGHVTRGESRVAWKAE